MTANTDIARLKITLDAVKPPVVRRIEVPLGRKRPPATTACFA